MIKTFFFIIAIAFVLFDFNNRLNDLEIREWKMIKKGDDFGDVIKILGYPHQDIIYGGNCGNLKHRVGWYITYGFFKNKYFFIAYLNETSYVIDKKGPLNKIPPYSKC